VSGDPAQRVQTLFDALFARDGAGGSWLAPLLEAAPRGPARLGELAAAPGWLEAPMAVRTETGRRGAFEYHAAPSRGLLGWLVDHPDELTRPAEAATATAETRRLRRALLDDPEPIRARARDRARDLLRGPPTLAPAWWRLEEAHTADGVLMTDRLVIVLQGRADGAPAEPATPWLPRRSARVRDLEAARRLADGGKAYGLLVLSGAPVPDGDPTSVSAAVAAGAPHLDDDERAGLADAYLGDLSWSAAAAAAGLELGAVPGWPG
jgi:hypothetical protein